MRLVNVFFFLVIVLFECSFGMGLRLPKLSVLVPTDVVPIEVTINGGYIPMCHSVPCPVSKMSKWRFIGDIGLSPLACEGSLDMACALTSSGITSSKEPRVTRKDLVFTRGEELILNKTRKITFTWTEGFGGSDLMMMLHYNDSLQTAFKFVVHPRLISISYNNGEGHNIGRVIIDIDFPDSCESPSVYKVDKEGDRGIGDIGDRGINERDSYKDSYKDSGKHMTMIMSERELLGCNTFRVPYGTRRISLRIHEDIRYPDDSLERYKYDLILYT